MTNISKLALAAAIVAVGIASPAFAQDFSPYGPIAAPHSNHTKTAARQGGLNAFAMAPSSSQYDPALNGGGSVGYNQNLREDTW
jgi:hypothetical protein